MEEAEARLSFRDHTGTKTRLGTRRRRRGGVVFEHTGMRIIYCIPTLGNGGAERQLSYLAAELQRMGHEVHVASSRGGPNLQRLKSVGVQGHSLGGVSNRDPLIFLRLVALMRRLRPDVVQTILAPMDIIAGAAALGTRPPWILKE